MRHDDREQWEAAKALEEEHQLQMGRELVSAATGGRPDFEGFIAALRAEADGTAQMFDENDNAEEINTLRELADRIEHVGERLGFL